MALTLLIVDDHALVREGIRNFLALHADIDVVGEAASGKEAVALAEQHIPDVVLLDLLMPEQNGVETTRQIKEVSPRTQVVILTSHHDDQHIFPALQAGALSYLMKDIKAPDLVEAVRKAARGEAILHPLVAARVVSEMHAPRVTANMFLDLTEREMDVLLLIAAGRNNHDIAAALGIAEKTVKGHVSNILSKLQLKDRTQAAVLAWQQGIMDS